MTGPAQPVQYRQPFETLQLMEDRLTIPLRRKKPTVYFVNSVSDLFHEDVPFDYIDRVFAVMGLAHQHTFQVLTKRADRMRAYIDRLTDSTQYACGTYRDWPQPLDEQMPWLTKQLGADRMLRLCEVPDVSNAWPHPNVWLGVSVENQHFADERIPLLLQTLAAVWFISLEPLLESVNIERFMWPTHWHWAAGYDSPEAAIAAGAYAEKKPQALVGAHCRFLNWVIVGGESGAGARPFDVAWARSIVQQCKSAGVPVFVKQLGAQVIDRNDAGFEGDAPHSWPMDTDVRDNINGFREEYQGAPVRILLKKKGGDMATWPADLQVREFPK